MKTKILTSDGINWTWFAGVTLNDEDKTCTVHFHERFHKAEKWPAAINEAIKIDRYTEFEFLEGADREAYGLRVRGRYVDGVTIRSIPPVDYLILNPAYVFSYKDFSQLKETV